MKFVFFSKTMFNFILKQFKTQENCQVSARLELNSKADLNHAERFLVPFLFQSKLEHVELSMSY